MRDTDDRTPDCRRVEPLLDDLVDGRLAAAAARRVRLHAGACESCAARLRGLEALLEAAADLPRNLEPERDLWPGVAARLTARRRRAARWPRLRQAAAAVALVALGGVLSQLLMPGWRDAVEPAADSALDPEAAFALAEADYLRAKGALWAAVYAGRDAVSPETREVVERNLRIIDQAIGELRLALEADPGNPHLESLLLARHRSELDLLRRLRRASLEG